MDHERLTELFREVAELPPSEREPVLSKLAPEERSILEKLLERDAEESRLPDEAPGRGLAQLAAEVLDEETGSPHEEASGSDAIDQALTSGERIGSYEVNGVLGRGGMGDVYRAWDPAMKRDVALKRVRNVSEVPSTVPDSQASRLARFVDEAHVTGQLEHPGIVPVYALEEDGKGHAYFTMQVVKGVTFKEVIDLVHANEDSWTLTRALTILQRASEALAYAHSKGVLHRDLKPSNIMTGPFGEAYVMDWGLAKVVDDQGSPASSNSPTSHRDPAMTMDGTIFGTPAYMSPEQARGQISEVDQRSDVYSMGAVLYHLLEGRIPYASRQENLTTPELLERVRAGARLPLEGRSSDELEAICAKAMNPDPEGRYPDMAAMAEDLRAHLEQRVVHAHRTGPWIELRKWVDRNKGLAASLMAAILLGIGGSGTIAWLQKKAKDFEASAKTTFEAQNVELDRVNENLRTSIDDYRRMADARRMQDLIREANEELWPARESKMSAMNDWLERAEGVLERLPVHRQTMASLEAARGKEAGDGWVFDSPEDQWQHDVTRGLVAQVEEHLVAENGLLASVTSRLDDAATIYERTVDSYADEWAEAMDDIASSEIYGEMEIGEQVGLVPLEPDPESGLWEFWVYESGEKPERDPESERWIIADDTGIILVLLPGGNFLMGAQKEDPNEPNFDEWVTPYEMPVHEVTLSPFFMAKYELTQGQWLKTVDNNPSHYTRSTMGRIFVDKVAPLSHPVERVTILDCERAAIRLGLSLPTEAQWEYACRAGTRTPYSTGVEMSTLQGAANLPDRTYMQFGGSALVGNVEWEDGFSPTAPVGRFAPNLFGIHDMHGNVWEWVRGLFGSYRESRHEVGNGLLIPADPKGLSGVSRGGSFRVGRPRSSARARGQLNQQGEDQGCRLARQLDE